MMKAMSVPQPLGLRKSFGFGDRLGLATPGHLAAARRFPDFAPIFAQQSIRELTRTQRTAEEVLLAAQKALDSANYTLPWGADGDHLKTSEDVATVAQAGFCFFTIDPSAHVDNAADRLSESNLETVATKMEVDGIFDGFAWRNFYLGTRFELNDGSVLTFTQEALLRAVVKYGRAVAHTSTLAGVIQKANAERPFEIEVSVDETDSPTSPLEHLFFAHEMRRRQVPNLISLAPRFIGDFEKGIDYRGNLTAFEAQLHQHVAIARTFGPYKISIHSGSDKFSAYPIIGRVCGDLLHVKTAGTSYLEALRVLARTQPTAFSEIAEYCRSRFAEDRASYHISTSETDIAALPPYRDGANEAVYLDEVVGRQLLHVTFGSVLTRGQAADGRSFKEILLACLREHPTLHEELLDKHFTRHLSQLQAG